MVEKATNPEDQNNNLSSVYAVADRSYMENSTTGIEKFHNNETDKIWDDVSKKWNKYEEIINEISKNRAYIWQDSISPSSERLSQLKLGKIPSEQMTYEEKEYLNNYRTRARLEEYRQRIVEDILKTINENHYQKTIQEKFAYAINIFEYELDFSSLANSFSGISDYKLYILLDQAEQLYKYKHILQSDLNDYTIWKMFVSMKDMLSNNVSNEEMNKSHETQEMFIPSEDEVIQKARETLNELGKVLKHVQKQEFIEYLFGNFNVHRSSQRINSFLEIKERLKECIMKIVYLIQFF